MHTTLLSLIFVSAGLSGFSQSFDYLPSSGSDNMIVHSHYVLSYSEAHEQARWVAYEITASEASGTLKRTDDFREDDSCRTGSATLKDYAGSGYHRGHLAPADDMKFSSEAISESFLMTNMSPQKPAFNSGIWRVLESQVNDWALFYDTLYIVTAGVLTDSLPYIGSGQVAVPYYFYKIVYDHERNAAIAFLLPNKKGSGKIYEYALPVDSIEKLTGIDFFPALPDNIEEKAESSFDLYSWGWKSSQKPQGATVLNIEQDKPANKNEVKSVRCSGTTNSGRRCKRMTENSSGKCWQHD